MTALYIVILAVFAVLTMGAVGYGWGQEEKVQNLKKLLAGSKTERRSLIRQRDQAEKLRIAAINDGMKMRTEWMATRVLLDHAVDDLDQVEMELEQLKKAG